MLIELIFKLSGYLVEKRISAGDIKITVEFLSPATQAKAEYLLCAEAGREFSMDMLNTIRNEQPWKMFGLNMQVKKYVEPTRDGCDCQMCKDRRDVMR